MNELRTWISPQIIKLYIKYLHLYFKRINSCFKNDKQLPNLMAAKEKVDIKKMLVLKLN